MFGRKLIFSTLLLVLPIAPAFAAESSLNLRTSPLGLFIGVLNARLDWGVTDTWVIGPQFNSLNRKISGVEQRAQVFGIAAAYYPAGVFEEGFYLDFGVSHARQTAQATSAAGAIHSVDFTNNSVRFLGGYHWFWLPFNLNIGAGLATNSAGEVKIRDSSGQEVDRVTMKPIGLALDLSLGLAF